MADDIRTAIYNAHMEGKAKFTYFLLAAAGACIAFAVNQTQNAALTWSEMPLAGALLCWCLSFSFGCFYLQRISMIQYDNLDLFRVQGGQHPMVGGDRQMMNRAGQILKKDMERNSSRGTSYSRWQFGMLISGALLYIAWHILAMYLRRH
jgi:hypothetical protein